MTGNIPFPKKGNAKKYSNYCTIALISYASKVMLKILQARLQQYVNHELPDVQAVLWTLWERERVGRFGRMAMKHVKYHVGNELPVQV